MEIPHWFETLRLSDNESLDSFRQWLKQEEEKVEFKIYSAMKQGDEKKAYRATGEKEQILHILRQVDMMEQEV